MNASYSLIRVVLSSIDTLFFWQIDLRMPNAPREGFRLLEEIEAVSVRLLSIALDSLDILRAWIDQCLGLSCHEQGRSSWRSACEGCMSPRQLMIKMSTRCPLDAPKAQTPSPAGHEVPLLFRLCTTSVRATFSNTTLVQQPMITTHGTPHPPSTPLGTLSSSLAILLAPARLQSWGGAATYMGACCC